MLLTVRAVMVLLLTVQAVMVLFAKSSQKGPVMKGFCCSHCRNDRDSQDSARLAVRLWQTEIVSTNWAMPPPVLQGLVSVMYYVCILRDDLSLCSSVKGQSHKISAIIFLCSCLETFCDWFWFCMFLSIWKSLSDVASLEDDSFLVINQLSHVNVSYCGAFWKTLIGFKENILQINKYLWSRMYTS